MTYYTWYILCILVMYEGVSCLTMEAKEETRASDFSTLAEVLPLLANPRNSCSGKSSLVTARRKLTAKISKN